MKIEKRQIPEGIRYLSKWEGFKNLPQHEHYILAKKICNCGATEAFIRSDKHLIIAMPRKHLLYNKYSQHVGEDIFLYRFLNKKQYFSDKTPTVNEMKEFDRLLIEYIENGGKKIMATYDSMPKITDMLRQLNKDPHNYQVVVDEFQQIIADAPFKPTIEHQFYNALKKYESVVYLSATPFLEQYLEMTEQFRNMKMIELEWPKESERKSEIRLIKLTKSITKKCCEIINQYKNGDVPYAILDGNRVESHEAVFFLNDVKGIISIIKKAGLKPDEVNILCAPRRENYDRIAKLNQGFGKDDLKFEKGEIPGEGELHKQFTFCTSTVYIGADFRSTNAYSFIFANPNVESLTIDVGTDIQQIIGRQRLDVNPFRLKADLYYTLKKPLVTEAEMADIIEEKKAETKRQIENFEDARHKDSFLNSIKSHIEKGHTDQYCCISEDEKGNQTIVENDLISIAEKRAWDIANKVYNGDFSLFKALEKSADVTNDVDSPDPGVKKVFDIWSIDGQFKRRAMIYCELREQQMELLNKCTFIPKYFHDYYDALGRKGFEDLQWRHDYIKDALAPTPPDKFPYEKVIEELKTRFLVGNDYTRDDIKQGLVQIYQTLDIKGKPTATDIKRYFTVKEFSKRIDKKKTAMIKIVAHWQKIVTIFQSIAKPKLPDRDVDIDTLLGYIKSGDNYNLKNRVNRVRNAKTNKEFDKMKFLLPVATWNGQFDYRGPNGCTNYSSFTAIDIDHVANMDGYKEWLQSFSCVYAYFKTPSGNGLKAIILHDNLRPELHADLYGQLLDLFDCEGLDTSTQDLSRGNYLSYDPDLWINPNVVPFHFEPRANFQLEKTTFSTQTVVKTPTGQLEVIDDDDFTSRFLRYLSFQIVSDESIIRILRKEWTQNTICRGRNLSAFSYAGILCKAGVEKGMAASFISELIPSLPSKELKRTVDNAYNLNTFGSHRRLYTKRKKSN